MNRINNKWNCLLFVTAIIISATSCKKQLNVGNPNAPTLGIDVTSEAGIIALAQGAVYVNGFQNGDVWLGNSYFSLPYGYNELLGDMIGSDVANQLISQLSVPDDFVLDNGTTITSATTAKFTLRSNNTRAQTANGYNPTYYQWLNMTALNDACNTVLSLTDSIPFSADKDKTIKAWCYWWKGYAYASMGTMYYAGLLVDTVNSVTHISISNSNYVTKEATIAHSNYYFNLAISTLNSISSSADYTEVLTQLIPSFCQVGHGGVLTPAMWIDNINTMLARNILLNKLAPFVNSNPAATITAGTTMTAMTAADWNDVLTLATNGVQSSDYVFTGRSVAANGFFTTGSGTIAAMSTGSLSSSTFHLSERFVQDFKTGDQRFANNFNYDSLPYQNSFSFGVRYNLIDGGNGLSANGVSTYTYGYKASANATGAYELFIGGNYEENALMLAEAYIRTNKIDQGLAYIDAVRAYQGAGDTTVSGKGLTLAQALQELVMERRVALAFRGVSFYDARRWGWTYDIANGGGSYGNLLLYTDPNTGKPVLNKNVTINYNFLDYWDLPADETLLNPPATGSAAVVNPN